jgi:MarR family transcriptional regulator, transcriptional regulator for hemolysin
VDRRVQQAVNVRADSSARVGLADGQHVRSPRELRSHGFHVARTNLNPLRTFGFLLKDTRRLYVQRFEQRASALGLTLPQCKALVYLTNHEGISQVQLGELTDLKPMTLVRILDRMESNGWLERRNDPADRRARRLYLTAKGRPLVDDIWHLVDLTRREAFVGIPRKHADLLIELLERIQGNFAALEPLQPMPAVAALQGGCHRPAHWSQMVIGMSEPVDDRRNGSRA